MVVRTLGGSRARTRPVRFVPGRPDGSWRSELRAEMAQMYSESRGGTKARSPEPRWIGNLEIRAADAGNLRSSGRFFCPTAGGTEPLDPNSVATERSGAG